MYVQVAQYRLGTGSPEELVGRIQQGPVRVMREVPGFIEYHAFDAGGGVVASVSVFEESTGLEEAERRLADWIEQTVTDFQISPGDVTEGQVLASTRSGD